MPIDQVLLSNTFNEFRSTFNDAANVINGLQSGSEAANVTTANVATANITSVDSNLTPTANITYDLGETNKRWRDLYLSGSTILLGSGQIKVEDDEVRFLVNGTEVLTANVSGESISDSLTANNITVNQDLLVSGNLTVNGTETILNTSILNVEDKNIVIANTASPTDVLADGGGITLKGDTDKTLNWVDATDSWTSSENFNLLTGKTYKINATDVLTATSLGTGVIGSSLTSVGTISSGTWQGTIIDPTYGGTGINNGANTIMVGGNLVTANAVGFSGDFSVTLTATGPTNVTLPTSGSIASTGKAIAMAIVFG
jgi:hypothetical protein